MIIPEEYRAIAIKAAISLLDDSGTEILSLDPNGKGGAIKDRNGNVLTITRDLVEFVYGEKDSAI